MFLVAPAPRPATPRRRRARTVLLLTQSPFGRPARAHGRMLHVPKRLALSFGKAAWIASTSFLILFVPLIIEMDREQQMIEMEKGELNVLTSKSA